MITTRNFSDGRDRGEYATSIHICPLNASIKIKKDEQVGSEPLTPGESDRCSFSKSCSILQDIHVYKNQYINLT